MSRSSGPTSEEMAAIVAAVELVWPKPVVVVPAPQKVSTWVRDFARAFHGFYRDCRVITDDAELTQARLWLTEATRVVVANGLSLIGVTLLALAMTGVVLFVADFVFDDRVAVVVTICVALLFAVVWYVLPLRYRMRDR